METAWKRIKYGWIIPMLAGFLSVLFKQFRPQSGKNGFFFIMGSGRNGSTLVSKHLNKHEEVFIPAEQFSLPYILFERQLKPWETWSRFIARVIPQILRRNQGWKIDPALPDEILRDLDSLEPADRSTAKLYEVVFRRYGERFKDGFKVVGDQSPLTTVFYQPILHHFNRSKVIFLMRHPFDVAVSYKQLKGNPAEHTSYALWKWKNAVRAYDWIRSKRPDDVLLVRYEDLVNEPEATLAAIQGFLDLPILDLAHIEVAYAADDLLGVEGKTFHANLNQPISNASVGKWKESVHKAELMRYRTELEAVCDRFGYQL